MADGSPNIKETNGVHPEETTYLIWNNTFLTQLVAVVTSQLEWSLSKSQMT